VNGKVIMYADRITNSMDVAIKETNRRRKIQDKYNKDHNITPSSIVKEIYDIIEREYTPEDEYIAYVEEYKKDYSSKDPEKLKQLREVLKENMLKAAEALDFEKAAVLRDQMVETDNKIKLLERTKKS
jgi:excinuclease ABC subunit B